MYPLALVVPIHRRADIMNLSEQISISNSKVDIFFVFVLDKSHDQHIEKFFEEEFEKFNLNKKVISGYYGNPGTARNAGIEESIEASWVMYLDADDRLELDEVHTYLKQPQLSTFSAIVFDYNEIHSLKEVKRVTSRDKAELALNPGIWRIAFRAESIRGIDFPPLILGEDQIYFLRTSVLNKKVFFSETLVYGHRVNTGSNISEIRTNYSSYRDLLEVLLSEIDSYSLNDLLRNLILIRLLLSSLKRRTLLTPSQYRSITSYFLFRTKFRTQILTFKNLTQKRGSGG